MRTSTKTVLTREQEEYLRLHYPTDPAVDIAEHFRISPPVVQRIAKEMGLKKAEGWRASQYNNRLVKNYTSERYKNYRVA